MAKNTPQAIDPSVFANDDDSGSDAQLPAGGFVIDFSSVPDSAAPVAAGTYNCTIVHAAPALSKAGNLMIKIRWRIDDDGEYNRRLIFDNLVFSPNALWRIRQVLEALGYAKDFNGEIRPESLLGESATLKITIQAGNGVNPETGEPYPPRNNVAKVLPAGSARKVDDLL